MGLAVMRLLLASTVLAAALAGTSAETVLERMRREKAKYQAQAATPAGKKAAMPDAQMDMIALIKDGNIEGVRRYLANAQSNDGAAVTDRMENGAWHTSCKVQSGTVSVAIASLFIKYNLPMNVSSRPRAALDRICEARSLRPSFPNHRAGPRFLAHHSQCSLISLAFPPSLTNRSRGHPRVSQSKNARGQSPLAMCIQYGNTEMVELLVRHFAPF